MDGSFVTGNPPGDGPWLKFVTLNINGVFGLTRDFANHWVLDPTSEANNYVINDYGEDTCPDEGSQRDSGVFAIIVSCNPDTGLLAINIATRASPVTGGGIILAPVFAGAGALDDVITNTLGCADPNLVFAGTATITMP